MWQCKTFQVSFLNREEHVRHEVCQFLDEQGLSPSDVSITETFTGLASTDLIVAVYWMKRTSGPYDCNG